MNRKEIESMFGSSVEVLESLLGEYEGRLGLGDEDGEAGERGDVEAMFGRFYDRLKFMLQTVCEQLHQYQSTKASSLEASHKTLQNTYDDSLFPQSISAPYTITKGPSTDQELYQLVVQMKTKSIEDRQKVISLEKALAETKRQNKQLEAKLKAVTGKCQHKDGQLLSMVGQIERLNSEKQNQTIKLKEKCDQISSLQLKIKQLQTQLQEKQLQITNISATLRLYEALKQKHNILNQQCANLKLNLIQNTKIKEELTFKLTKSQQKTSELLKENKKLKVIIAKKLPFLQQDQFKGKENVFLEQNKGGKNMMFPNAHISSQRYVKDLVGSLIGSQSLISQTVERQLCAFVGNLISVQHHQSALSKKRNSVLHNQ